MSDYVIYYGTFVHSLSLSELDIISQGVLVIDNKKGTIVHLERNVNDFEDFLFSHQSWGENAKIHKLGPEQFLIPGFVDTHAHAPQYMFAGSGMDLQLLEWLDTYVFPCESDFKDTDHAARAYEAVVRRFIKNGTTTCSWFATIHVESCKRLVDILHQLGQRAYVGKVNMDQNAPDYYIEKTEDSIRDTEAFIQYVQAQQGLVTPVITPRFAITCSSKLLNALGELADRYQVPIQSHLCENPDEISFTCSLFKDSKDYTSVYDDHGLLTERSYMAHCVHMTDDEIDLLIRKRVGISHCANSNFSLHSGICDVRRMLERGVDKLGLGTDVAGGFQPSMLDAIRSSFFASKTCKILARDRDGNKDYAPLSPAELLYLATMGGARVLGLEETIGNFQVGKAFDALWVDLEGGSVDLMGGETILQKVQKFLFNGSSENLKHVYVQGKRIAGADKDSY
ncbi:guanine deaminase [Cokeromyces recurvatus]|uniref:guanine deaminase n=1 Tax=Cokeromyces recurvatus TaxID=90255 RepID=UPI00221FEDDC|nr:guanine deaminase [Cokeromyces recurvatus]KAI7903840.1 guanine deaminase [Cokeromyces recurvatus]